MILNTRRVYVIERGYTHPIRLLEAYFQRCEDLLVREEGNCFSAAVGLGFDHVRDIGLKSIRSSMPFTHEDVSR